MLESFDPGDANVPVITETVVVKIGVFTRNVPFQKNLETEYLLSNQLKVQIPNVESTNPKIGSGDIHMRQSAAA